MEKKNYFLEKDDKSGELLYLEYDKINGYNITPKTKIEDAIKVNKIVFVNSTLSEKLIRKKIDIKIRHLLQKLNEIDIDDEDSGGEIEKSLMEAEKLRMMIINTYVKYLGNTYKSLTLKKIQVIINQLKIKLYNYNNIKKLSSLEELYYLDDEEEEKRGRGR